MIDLAAPKGLRGQLCGPKWYPNGARMPPKILEKITLKFETLPVSRRPPQESRGISAKILITGFVVFYTIFYLWAALGGHFGCPRGSNFAYFGGPGGHPGPAGCLFLSSWRSWGALGAPRSRQRAPKAARTWITRRLWVPFWIYFGTFWEQLFELCF